METFLSYLTWLIVTSVWSMISDQEKEEVIIRYILTFIAFSCFLYFYKNSDIIINLNL